MERTQGGDALTEGDRSNYITVEKKGFGAY